MFACHAHYSAVSSPCGKPEVSLEPYWRGHAIFHIKPKYRSWVYQRPVTMAQSMSLCKTPIMYLQLHQRPQIRSSQHGCPMTLQKQDKITKIRDMGVLETFQHTHIRIEMPNPGHKSSTSFNAPKYELKGCTWSLDLQNQDREKRSWNLVVLKSS